MKLSITLKGYFTLDMVMAIAEVTLESRVREVREKLKIPDLPEGGREMLTIILFDDLRKLAEIEDFKKELKPAPEETNTTFRPRLSAN
jgi:hypothetical protein